MLSDNDGVLVEPPSIETEARATRAAFGEVGVDEPDPEQVAAVVDGITVDRLDEVCSESAASALLRTATSELIDAAVAR